MNTKIKAHLVGGVEVLLYGLHELRELLLQLPLEGCPGLLGVLQLRDDGGGEPELCFPQLQQLGKRRTKRMNY